MKKILILFLFVIFLCISCPSAYCKGISPFIKQLSNNIMENIYNDLELAKFKYPGLEGFDKSALSKNQHGIYTIEFVSGSKKSKDEPQFSFGITLVGVDDKNFNNKGSNSFDFGFPLLGIKFAGYQVKDSKNMDFDVTKYILNQGKALLEEQNNKMPILLSMETDSDVYKAGEEIEVKISLTNVTDKTLRVRNFAPQTLYLFYKDVSWGKEDVDQKTLHRVKTAALEPKESINKIFILKGTDTPQDLTIFCTYRMTFKGVSPAISKTVKIVSP